MSTTYIDFDLYSSNAQMTETVVDKPDQVMKFGDGYEQRIKTGQEIHRRFIADMDKCPRAVWNGYKVGIKDHIMVKHGGKEYVGRRVKSTTWDGNGVWSVDITIC